MLIINNGAPKSGSTWIGQIIKRTGIAEPLPEELRNPGWLNPSFHPNKLKSALEPERFSSNLIFCKQHWRGESIHHKIAGQPHVRMINIIRDVRDVCVSRYFHDVRHGHFKGSMDDFFSTGQARSRIDEYVEYHRFWHAQPHPILLLSYERMQHAFKAEVRRLFEFIDLEPARTETLLKLAKRKTDMKRQTMTGEGHHRRKGVVGDHANHLSPDQIETIDGWLKASDYPAIKQNMLVQYPMLKRHLKSIDIGILETA
ncbi:MAG: sulfotransferase domain-containing protein [Hyphomonadaceae bacterium]|nr:sulfotransferase domain-containing protein [Hyphomonadaceae bacterium]